MPKQVKALQKVYYAGREYTPGEVFFTQADTDAEAMTLVGTAEYFTEPEPVKRRTRMTPEQVAEANQENEQQEEPRRYTRRDMRAED